MNVLRTPEARFDGLISLSRRTMRCGSPTPMRSSDQRHDRASLA